MLNDRENILSALRQNAMKVREIMKRANIANEEVCQSLLLKMRGEGVVKFDIHPQWTMAHRVNCGRCEDDLREASPRTHAEFRPVRCRRLDRPAPAAKGILILPN
jgi:hypothetical protein